MKLSFNKVAFTIGAVLLAAIVYVGSRSDSTGPTGVYCMDATSGLPPCPAFQHQADAEINKIDTQK